MKINLIVVFLSLSLGKTFAQINESDISKFQIRASLTGNYQQGNVEVLNIKTKIDITVKPIKKFVFKTQNSSLYQSFYEKKADNDIFSRNYLYYNPEKKVYPFAIAYISSNYRRKIDHRYFVGGGATWQIINKENYVLKLSSSTVYETTKFKNTSYNDLEYDGSNTINTWRGTLYVGGWCYFLEKHLRFFYDAYWQPAFNNRNNYRNQLDLGADFPIYKGLSFNTVFAYTHENIVISNIKQNDKILTFGLSYNFKTK
ncbi:DUF481 domain-containing protein [Flavobacterium sp.]|uniref:DUF481 domain-containing protein n=1 Tax=Flavobacterium sp. TaxID=239 RepID=UPI0026285C1F|nr:DUF481 domain-containing protein [Flavobacterium sp.]